MKEPLTALAAAVTGAAVMFFLDPDRGRRRRAVARDRLAASSRRAGHYARAQGKRASHRVEGFVARRRARLTATEPGDDRQLGERVRSKLGRAVDHPGAIDVEVDQGNVRLYGKVLAAEVDALISTVSSVPGVRNVENHLSVHEEAGNIPELQGAGRRADGSGRPASRGAVLPWVALTAAPLAILLGAAGRVTFRGRNGANGRPARGGC